MQHIINSTAACTSFQDSSSYVTFLFSEWRIPPVFDKSNEHCTGEWEHKREVKKGIKRGLRRESFWTNLIFRIFAKYFAHR